MIETVTAYKCSKCGKIYKTEIEAEICLDACFDKCNEKHIIEICNDDEESLDINISYNDKRWEDVIKSCGDIYIEQDGNWLLIPSNKVDELCKALQKFKTMWLTRIILNKLNKGDK